MEDNNKTLQSDNKDTEQEIVAAWALLSDVYDIKHPVFSRMFSKIISSMLKMIGEEASIYRITQEIRKHRNTYM